MPLRPGRCYRYLDTQPYTRKEYISGIPQPKIAKFDMGSPNIDFPVWVDLVSEEEGLVRHNALEAARIAANRYMSRNVGEAKYHLRIMKYPHHVLRENKMLAMAGADRLQDGMRKAFGKPIGTAAIVHSGDTLLRIRVYPENIEDAKEALRRAMHKFPMPCRIKIKLLGNLAKYNT